MPKIDIGDIKYLRDMRPPYLGMLYDERLSVEAHAVLWAIQRLVDLDLPLTISTISDATDLDHFIIKQKIDEVEQIRNFRLREHDERTGKYRLIRW